MGWDIVFPLDFKGKIHWCGCSYPLFQWTIDITPGPHLMRIHLVRYSTSARYENYSIIHLVRPIIHLVRIFALSTSWIN